MAVNWDEVELDVEQDSAALPTGRGLPMASGRVGGINWSEVELDSDTTITSSPKTDDVGVVSAAGRGLVRGTIGLAEAVNSGVQYLGNRVGSETMTDLGKSGADYWQKKGEEYDLPEQYQGNVVDNPELLANGAWWAYNVAQVVPSLAASIVPGVGASKVIQAGGAALKWTPEVVARLAQIGGAVSGGVVGGGLEGASTYQAVMRDGGTEEEAARAGELMTLASAGLNAISLNSALAKSDSVLKKFLISGVVEGTTEGLEEPAEAAIVDTVRYGEINPENMKQSLKEAATVFGPAALTGGFGGAMVRSTPAGKRVDEQPAREEAQPVVNWDEVELDDSQQTTVPANGVLDRETGEIVPPATPDAAADLVRDPVTNELVPRDQARKMSVKGDPLGVNSAVKDSLTAGVPVMITKRMGKRLMDLGYAEDEIRKLTPQQAHEIIGAGKKNADLPGAESVIGAAAEAVPATAPVAAVQSATETNNTPHAAPLEPAHPEGLLFGKDATAGQASSENAQIARPLFTPTHETVDGTLVRPYDDEPGVWEAADGTIIEDGNAAPIKAEDHSKDSARPIEPVIKKPAPKRQVAEVEASPSQPDTIGDVGTSDAQGNGELLARQFAVRQHGKKLVVVDVKSQAEVDEVRRRLVAAGVAKKGVYHAKGGALKFDREYEAAIRGALVEAEPTAAAAKDQQSIKYPLGSTSNEIYGKWQDVVAGRKEPTADQQRLINAVADAKKDVGISLREIGNHVTKALGGYLPPNIDIGIDRGAIGSEIYSANEYLMRRAAEQASAEASSRLNLKPGAKVGSMTTNDGKMTRGAYVEKIDDGGNVHVIGTRGPNKVRFIMSWDALERAIERANGKAIFTKRGDYWNYSGGRAEEIARKLNLTITTRDGKKQVGIPDHARERMAQEMSAAGIQALFQSEQKQPEVAAPEAIQPPAINKEKPAIDQAAKEVRKTLGEREVDRAKAKYMRIKGRSIYPAKAEDLANAERDLRRARSQVFEMDQEMSDDEYDEWKKGRDTTKSVAQSRPVHHIPVATKKIEPSQTENAGGTSQRVAEPDKQRALKEKVAKRKAKAPDMLDRLENYFRPGRIVTGYGSNQDKVLDFKRRENGQWQVQVVAVDKDGNQVEKYPRTHMTAPSTRELVDWEKDNPIEQHEPQTQQTPPKSGVSVSEQVAVKQTDAEVAKAKEALQAAGVTGKELREAIADVRQGNLTADEVAESVAESPAVSAVQAHDDLMKRVDDGDATAEEFKAAFESLVANRDAILTDLGKKTKQELLDRLDGMSAQRYKNEKKARAVDAAYGAMIRDFLAPSSIGGMFSYGHTPGDRFGGLIKAVKARVEKITDEDIRQHAEDVAKHMEERKQQIDERAAGIEDPKTVDDFIGFIRSKQAENEGMTFGEARMMLTPEQRTKFDDLVATETRAKRVERKEDARTHVGAAGATTGAEIIETKHTRDGYDLFVVKTEERVERDVYQQWLEAAKKMGGWYSKFRGNGAIPGFQFKTREAADAFQKYVSGGDTEAVQEQAKARRDAFADDRSQSAVERLNEMADRLDEQADESLGRERKANTARRARFAARAEAAASSQKAMAATMRNIAAAVESGDAKFLDRVRQKTQIEMLQTFTKVAHGDMLRKKYPTYGEQEKHQGDNPTAETADYVTWPAYTAYRSDLASLGRALLETEGTKKIGQRIMKVADDVTDAYLTFAKENWHKVSTFTTKEGVRAVLPSKAAAEAAIARSGYRGQAIVLPFKRGENIIIMSPSEAQKRGIWDGDNDKRITLSNDLGAEIVEKLGRTSRGRNRGMEAPWQFVSAYEKRKRLAAMGIETPAELRAALREFIGLRQSPKEADKIKAMERAMVGRRNDGLDFFPTPATVADEMIDAADIKEGMSVLEPSAGMGHIAERIREAGVDPDVIELSSDRRELLEAKGFRLVGNDFMDIKPREFFMFGDTFRAQDGVEGVMRGGGGLGSNRVRLVDDNGVMIGWYDRDELTGLRKNGIDSGYDRIIMNPPFGDRRDALHVQHAYEMLKPGGRIVAIMGEGVFFGQDKKAQEFRNWLEQVGATDEKLDEGTFLDPSLPVTTGVNARMVVIDKNDSAPSYAIRSNAPQWYYSQMQQVLERKLPNAGGVGDLRVMIANLAKKGEFKQEELEWSGLIEWLQEQKGKISKAEVLEFLKAGDIQIEETELGGGGRSKDEIEADAREQFETDFLDNRNETSEAYWYETSESEKENAWNDQAHISWKHLGPKDNYIKRATDEDGDVDMDEAKAMFDEDFDNLDFNERIPESDLKDGIDWAWNEYKRNYIEDQERADGDAALYNNNDTKFSKYQTPGGENYRELLLTLPEKAGPEPDAVAMEMFGRRMNELSYSYQEKVRAKLREAKSRNYKSIHFDEPNILAHVRFNERTDADGKHVLFLEEVQSDWHQKGRKTGYGEKWGILNDTHVVSEYGYFDTQEDAQKEAEIRSEQLEALGLYHLLTVVKSVDNGVPDAPFKTTWPMLAMKRMIRYATENGFDRIAWTTGEQQAERYDLSKQISQIRYEKSSGGMGNEVDESVKKSGTLLAYDHDGNRVIDRHVNDDDLADYIGKEAAEKLMQQAPRPGRTGSGTGGISRTLSGLDLKVGGEGMKGFYDKILPSEVNKYVKKWGAKVGGTTFFHSLDERGRDFDAHAIDITPAMREAAMAGQPLFAGRKLESSERITHPGMAVTKGTVAGVRKAIAGTVLKWGKNRPKVEVVQSVSDLPQHLRPAPGTPVFGVHEQAGGAVYLVADNLGRAIDVKTILAHEAVGHYAMEEMLGDELMADVVQRVQWLKDAGDKVVLELADEVARDYGGLPPVQESKEIIAKLAERREMKGKLAKLFDSIMTAVRKFLRRLGFDVLFSNKDLEAVLADAERWLKQDGGKRTQMDNALWNPRLGEIDLVMGDGGTYGASRWAAKHPEVGGDVGRLVADAKVVQRDAETATLKNGDVTFDLIKRGDRWRLTDAGVSYAQRGGYENGPFGPIYNDLKGDFHGAVERLMDKKTGEVHEALFHPSVGYIDLVWGDEGTVDKNFEDGYGLAKIIKKHPEVSPHDLAEIIIRAKKMKQKGNSVDLETADHKAVIKLDWNGSEKTWLLTAYEMKSASVGERIGAAIGTESGALPGQEADSQRNIGQDGQKVKNAPSDVGVSGDGGGHSYAIRKTAKEFQQAESRLGDYAKYQFEKLKNKPKDARKFMLSWLTGRQIVETYAPVFEGEQGNPLEKYQDDLDGMLAYQQNRLHDVDSIDQRWEEAVAGGKDDKWSTERRREERLGVDDVIIDSTYYEIRPWEEYAPVLNTKEARAEIAEKEEQVRKLGRLIKSTSGGAYMDLDFGKLPEKIVRLKKQMNNLLKDRTLTGEARRRAKIEAGKLQQQLDALQALVSGPRNKNMERFEQINALTKEVEQLQRRIQFEGKRRLAYPGLVKQWEKLSPASQQLIKDIEQSYKSQFEAMQQALEERLEDAIDNGKARAEAITSMRQMFSQALQHGPYFPLARFGDYVVTARDENGEYVREHAESEFDQQQVVKLMEQAGYSEIKPFKLAEMKADDFKGAPGFAADVIQLLNEHGVTNTKVKDDVFQLALKMMPELSYAKRSIHRRKTAGFSRDTRRAFASTMFHGWNHIAKIKYGHKLQGDLDQMQQIIEDYKAGDESPITAENVNAATDVVNHMNDRHESIMNPQGHPLTALAGNVGFVWMLGGSVAAGVVNMTQTALVSMPMLAARYGWAKTFRALMKAAGEFALSPFKPTTHESWKSLSRSERLSQDEREMIQRRIEDGTVDLTQAHWIAQLADTDIRHNSKGEMRSGTKKAMRYVSSFFHNAEVMNREVTLLAAYRLAKEAGDANAEKSAQKITWDSHFDYGSQNRALYMKNNWVKVMTMMKNFSQHMLYAYWSRAFKQIRSLPKEEKAMARRELIGITGMHMLFAGTLGMAPFMGELFSIIDWAGGDDDDPLDSKLEFQNWAFDNFGPFFGTALTKGVFNAMGVDLHSRVNIDETLYREPDRELSSGHEQTAYYLEQAAGPMFGLATNMVFGAGKLLDGVKDGDAGTAARGVEQAMPKFIKDLFKAERYVREGGVMTKNKEPIMDDVAMDELLMTALGFTPARLEAKYDRRSTIKRIEEQYRDRRTKLMNEYYLALKARDYVGRQKAMDRIIQYNAANRDKPYVMITSQDIRRSAMGKFKAGVMTEDGVYLNRRYMGLKDEVRVGGE